MLDKTSLLIGVAFMAAAQIAAWFQLNGQFIWDWCRKHEWLMIILPSIPISFFYLYATKYLVQGFGGIMWPGRFISFGVGVIVFAVLVYALNNEGLSLKTLVSLALAVGLICIQVLWK
jgi:hypothetical protein